MSFCCENPFTPGFGEVPYIVTGRSDIIDGYGEAIESGDRSHNKHLLIEGMRGYGKTVLLRKLLEAAGGYGYETFYIPSASDMYKNLMESMKEKAGTSISETSEHADRTLESLIRIMLK